MSGVIHHKDPRHPYSKEYKAQHEAAANAPKQFVEVKKDETKDDGSKKDETKKEK